MMGYPRRVIRFLMSRAFLAQDRANPDLFPLAGGALAWADRDPHVSRIKLATVDGLGFRAPVDVGGGARLVPRTRLLHRSRRGGIRAAPAAAGAGPDPLAARPHDHAQRIGGSR